MLSGPEELLSQDLLMAITTYSVPKVSAELPVMNEDLVSSSCRNFVLLEPAIHCKLSQMLLPLMRHAVNHFQELLLSFALFHADIGF